MARTAPSRRRVQYGKRNQAGTHRSCGGGTLRSSCAKRSIEATVGQTRTRYADERKRYRDRRETGRLGFPARLLERAVDGERQRTGFARNVGHERDDRAEFAEARGKCRDQAGNNARQGKRKSDAQEAVESGCAERFRRLNETGILRFQRKADRAVLEGKRHETGRQRRASPTEGETDAPMGLEPGTERLACAEDHQKEVTD